jgi:hypothetical protein
MRIVFREYVDETRYVYWTEDDGQRLHVLEGCRQPGEQIRIKLDVDCSDAGKETLLEALAKMQTLLAERFKEGVRGPSSSDPGDASKKAWMDCPAPR